VPLLIITSCKFSKENRFGGYLLQRLSKEKSASFWRKLNYDFFEANPAFQFNLFCFGETKKDFHFNQGYCICVSFL
jgi:hypothetical protein